MSSGEWRSLFSWSSLRSLHSESGHTRTHIQTYIHSAQGVIRLDSSHGSPARRGMDTQWAVCALQARKKEEGKREAILLCSWTTTIYDTTNKTEPHTTPHLKTRGLDCLLQNPGGLNQDVCYWNLNAPTKARTPGVFLQRFIRHHQPTPEPNAAEVRTRGVGAGVRFPAWWWWSRRQH